MTARASLLVAALARASVCISLVVGLALGAGCAGCSGPDLPAAPRQCDDDGKGCLPDEQCTDGVCTLRPKCTGDADCQGPAWECVFPVQICQLRPGFGEECSAAAPCDVGNYCALGKCLPLTDARPCTSRNDCANGFVCDRQSFFCIAEGPCTLATDFPELACDPGQTCDVISERCALPCQEECTPATVEEDCGAQLKCDGSCRCVQCLTTADCGPGLVCNARAGRCQSDNLCFSDDDCEPPLVCEPHTALCQVPPPPCESDFDCAIAEICDLATGDCVLPDGPCTDDRFEQSDTPSAAHAISVDVGETVVLDALQICAADDDVYAVALEAGDIISAEITGTAPTARATLWLVDSLGESSLRFAETPPRGNGRVTYTADVSQLVYLRIGALVGPTPYDLTVTRSSGVPCVPDAFDAAGTNETPATATAVGVVDPGVPLQGGICLGDVDVYRVEVAPGERLEATLAFDAGAADLDLAFMDANGVVVAQASTTQAPEVLRARYPDGGTYYVRVRGFGPDTAPYALTLNLAPPFACTADAREPDSGVDTAVEVPLNIGLPLEARTLCTEDSDLLRVPLEDFERLIVRARYDDADLRAVVEILDETGTEVLRTSPAASNNATVTWAARSNETVLVRVRGKNGAVGSYSLELLKENQAGCLPDSKEPNDTFATAAALPAPDTLLRLCTPDEDDFLVTAEAGKAILADASFTDADADIDLALIGLDGAQVLAVADGTDDFEHLAQIVPLDGTYVLRVFTLQGSADARYTLDVRVVTP